VRLRDDGRHELGRRGGRLLNDLRGDEARRRDGLHRLVNVLLREVRLDGCGIVVARGLLRDGAFLLVVGVTTNE
jgi:hypothetical protein